MTGETNIQEKEIEAISVTLDEIEDAIRGLNAMRDTFMQLSKNEGFMSMVSNDVENAIKVANAMDEDLATAIKSMKFLHGAMKVNGLTEMSGIQDTNLGMDRNKNTPLTADELRKMDGKPVWCVGYGISLWFIVVVSDEEEEDGTIPFWVNEPVGEEWDYIDYGKEWLAYRQEI